MIHYIATWLRNKPMKPSRVTE